MMLLLTPLPLLPLRNNHHQHYRPGCAGRETSSSSLSTSTRASSSCATTSVAPESGSWSLSPRVRCARWGWASRAIRGGGGIRRCGRGGILVAARGGGRRESHFEVSLSPSRIKGATSWYRSVLSFSCLVYSIFLLVQLKAVSNSGGDVFHLLSLSDHLPCFVSAATSHLIAWPKARLGVFVSGASPLFSPFPFIVSLYVAKMMAWRRKPFFFVFSSPSHV